jgi:hypothetical protein
MVGAQAFADAREWGEQRCRVVVGQGSGEFAGRMSGKPMI